MIEENIKNHEEWEDKEGVKLKLCSIEGKWHKILNSDKEDRLFFLKINDSDAFFITHDQQLELMRAILMNDILYPSFINNIKKFERALKKIREDWEIENNKS